MRYNPQNLLSPTEKIEVIAWYRAKKALGSFKSKAKEIGKPKHSLEHFVAYERRMGRL